MGRQRLRKKDRIRQAGTGNNRAQYLRTKPKIKWAVWRAKHGIAQPS